MKKEPLVDNQFMKSIAEITDAYIQLDSDSKAWARKMIDHFKNVMLDEAKPEKVKQNHTQGSSQDRKKVVVFPGCTNGSL